MSNRGDGNRYGRKTGLSRGQFIVALFENQMNAKLTDKELIEVIEAEFPNSTARYEKYLHMYRNKYNRGDFSCQVEAPKIPVPEFAKDGKAVFRRKGPPPRLAGEEKEKRRKDEKESS